VNQVVFDRAGLIPVVHLESLSPCSVMGARLRLIACSTWTTQSSHTGKAYKQFALGAKDAGSIPVRGTY